MHLAAFDRVRARIAAEGFTPDMQTRIALFLCATKAVNLPFLTLAAAGPAQGLVWQALTSQLFREAEALTLLLRVTQWSLDPAVYAESLQMTAPLYAESARSGFTGWPPPAEGVGLEALALGHALLATVRLAPVVPAGEAALSPFAVALLRIEQENGRLLQTQIRLLKDGYAAIPLADRENAIGAKAAAVDAAFARFLDALAGRP
jgi:hypothetical protein